MENTKEIKTFIRDLAKILRDSDLGEVRVEQGDLKIRVSKSAVAGEQVAMAYPAAAPVQAPTPAPAPAAVAASEAAAASPPQDAVLSPMVGTAFTSPEPGAAPFVKEGDMVSEGQTILIIEAMKVMNQIPAPRSGKVTKVLITDAQPVEFNEPLLVIE